MLQIQTTRTRGPDGFKHKPDCLSLELMRFSNKVENIFIWNGSNGHQCNGPLHIVDESAAGLSRVWVLILLQQQKQPDHVIRTTIFQNRTVDCGTWGRLWCFKCCNRCASWQLMEALQMSLCRDIWFEFNFSNCFNFNLLKISNWKKSFVAIFHKAGNITYFKKY